MSQRFKKFGTVGHWGCAAIALALQSVGLRDDCDAQQPNDLQVTCPTIIPHQANLGSAPNSVGPGIARFTETQLTGARREFTRKGIGDLPSLSTARGPTLYGSSSGAFYGSGAAATLLHRPEAVAVSNGGETPFFDYGPESDPVAQPTTTPHLSTAIPTDFDGRLRYQMGSLASAPTGTSRQVPVSFASTRAQFVRVRNPPRVRPLRVGGCR